MTKQSQAWKNLERYVAKYFGGKRIPRGADFGQSLPDVIAPSPYPKGGSILVECKYSQNQPWIDLLMREAKKYDHLETVLIFKAGQFVFWDLEMSSEILNKEHTIITLKRRVPGYIKENYNQCVTYLITHPTFSQNIEPAPYLPMVVMGKRQCPVRVAYTLQKTFNEYFNE